MSPLTLVYAVAVGALLSAAAVALEAALRHRRLPARWVWIAALLTTLASPMWGPALHRESAPLAATLELPRATVGAPAEPAPGPSRMDRLVALAAREDARIAMAWALAAAVGLLLVGGALVHLGRRVARMPRGRVGGDEVVVSDDLGPACVGLARARVVIPRWLLSLSRSDLDLVLRHERAHAEARDPLLLAGALCAVAVAPWNPALWWQMRRLRRAVELDCDRRVLATGAAAGDYGRVLLEVLGRVRPRAFPAPALLEPTSFLERRLTLMKRHLEIPTHRTIGALILASGFVALACEAPAPTSVAPTEPAQASSAQAGALLRDRAGEPAGAGPAADERARESSNAAADATFEAREVPLLREVGPRPETTGLPSEPAVFLDRRPLVGGVPDDLDPDDIESIDVLKGAAALERAGEAGRAGVIEITTKAEAGGAGAGARQEFEEGTAPAVEESAPENQAGSTFTLRGNEIRFLPPHADTLLVMVDGVRLEGGMAALDALPKAGAGSIASVEVIKGGAAERIFGPEGRNGVVQVTTRGTAPAG
jgi:hypothetical protein